MPAPRPTAEALYALVGNPNCGKTTVFNALTGLRQKVGNYPGVTVEKKIGRVRLPGGASASLIDLPRPLLPGPPLPRRGHRARRAARPPARRAPAAGHPPCRGRRQPGTQPLPDIPGAGPRTADGDHPDHDGRRRPRRPQVDIAALEKLLGVPVRVVIAAKNEGLDTLRAGHRRPAQHAATAPARRGCCRPRPRRKSPSWPGCWRTSTAHAPRRARWRPSGLLMQDALRPEEQGRWSQPIVDHVRADKRELRRPRH